MMSPKGFNFANDDQQLLQLSHRVVPVTCLAPATRWAREALSGDPPIMNSFHAASLRSPSVRIDVGCTCCRLRASWTRWVRCGGRRRLRWRVWRQRDPAEQYVASVYGWQDLECGSVPGELAWWRRLVAPKMRHRRGGRAQRDGAAAESMWVAVDRRGARHHCVARLVYVSVDSGRTRHRLYEW